MTYIKVHQNIATLLSASKQWFGSLPKNPDVVKQTVKVDQEGVYCLWWKNPDKFPTERQFSLPAGKRGNITITLKRPSYISGNTIALYIGKGKIRSRLSSHVNPKSTDKRGPYWWLKKTFENTDIDQLIKENVGFSYIELSKREQIFAENLAIGILRPWFNFRLTS